MTTVDGVLVVTDDANRSSRRRRHDQDQDGHDGHSDQKGKGRRKGKGGGLRAYPRAVFYMLGNEFCERFSFYGMRSVLTLYLILEHGFRDSTASMLYHAFISLAYFSALFGSIAADQYFGRFRVILWVSLTYVLGHVLLSIGAVPQVGLDLRSVLDFSGLFVIALSTGGIKPCVSAFAADQFGPEQARERTQFFSFFYFAINAGSVFAMFVTPILRGRVHCFGAEHCFPLAFGVPGLLMLAAFLIFLAGVPHYRREPPPEKGGKDAALCSVFRCVWHAGRAQLGAWLGRLGARERAAAAKPDHWLDRAVPVYGEQLVADVKRMGKVLALLVPVVLFWALFDQQGSTWVLQARQMDGRIGPFTVFADQMMTLNPLIVLVAVPVFEAWVYPAVGRCGCRLTPLRKMGAGGLLAALSFVLAGLLQLQIARSSPPAMTLATGEHFFWRLGNSTTRVFIATEPHGIGNGSGIPSGELIAGERTIFPAPVDGRLSLVTEHGGRLELVLGGGGRGGGGGQQQPHQSVDTSTETTTTTTMMTVNTTSATSSTEKSTTAAAVTVALNYQRGDAPCGYVVALFDVPAATTVAGNRRSKQRQKVEHSFDAFPYSCRRPENSHTRLLLVADRRSPLVGTDLVVLDSDGEETTRARIQPVVTTIEIRPTFWSSPHYTLVYGGDGGTQQRVPFTAQSGAVAAVLLYEAGQGESEKNASTEKTNSPLLELVPPNAVNIGWQLPQFVVITIGEVLLSVSGLEFCYTQAPPAMKSVMQAAWLLTTFFGDLIDMVISGAHLIADPAVEFFTYAGIAFAVICVFIWLATGYEYAREEGEQEEEDGLGSYRHREDGPPGLGEDGGSVGEMKQQQQQKLKGGGLTRATDDHRGHRQQQQQRRHQHRRGAHQHRKPSGGAEGEEEADPAAAAEGGGGGGGRPLSSSSAVVRL